MNSSITKLHVAPAELFAAILAVVLTAGPGAAQYFGQNKVQYRELDWAVLRTGNFEIYFHEGLREAVVDVGRMAERAYARHSRILDHELADPIQLIIYASQSEFQQTNITPWMVGEGTGGFTEIARRRVALPLTGSYAEFETILTHELVHAFQLDILGGSGDRSVLNPSTYMPPLWFIEGTAEYLSIGGIDPMTEMWLRDGALQGYLTPIKVLDSTYDIRVYRYGQALLHYLGSTYGDHKIGDIYRELPSLRSMERAFEKVVGLTMEKFSEDWTEAMRRSHLPRIAELVKPGEFAFRLTDSGKDRARLSVTPAVSPDGGLMVYFADRALHTELTLASALTGRTQRRLVRGEQDADYESLRFFRSAMDWSPDGSHICFVAASGGRDMVHIQRISDGRIIRRIDTGLDGILSPSFSPDGGWIVFSGLKGGRSALYRVKASGDRLERLTDDMYRAQEPRYSPDGRRIVFVTDQGGEGEIENLIYPPPQLAILDLETGAVEPLDGMAGTNISPFFSQDGRRILYVSDRSGIANLFIRDLDSGEDRRITDIITGISGVTSTSPALSLSRDGRRAVFSAFSKGSWDLYAIKDPMLLWDSHEPDEEPRTPVLAGALLPVQDLPADGADPADCTEAGISGPPADMDASDSPDPGDPEPDPAGRPGTELAEAGDVAGMLSRDEARLDSLWRRIERLDGPESGGVHEPGRTMRPAGRTPDSTSPVIDVAAVHEEKRVLPDSAGFEFDRYRARFTADYVSANGFFASNVGLSAQSVLQFSDVLGDQIILVGANVYGSLSDSDLLFSYVNLRKRTNWGVSVFQYRNDFYIFTASEDEYHSQIFRGANLTLQRPFSRFRRVEWSLEALSLSEEVYRESFSSGRWHVHRADKGDYIYVAPGAALVHDNSAWGPTGPISGGRRRLSVQAGLGDLQFRTLVGDIRRYHNIRHRYAFAVRVIGAASYGMDPQYFRMGGPYTLRGYPYGKFRGTRMGLVNVEFRFPLIEYLQMGFPFRLALGGIRGALFLDAGAAWENTGEFRAFRTDGGDRRLGDIRASYGLSAAWNIGFTVLRWDLAWRTDLSRNIGPARGYLSLGLDF